VAELAVSSAKTLQQHSPQAAIARASTAVTAFIGRALKGPVNEPAVLHSFDEYQRLFGGLWQPSTLSYAVEQYFEHGGRECIVVRVCNGGRAPTLRLPSAAGASAPALTLVGVAPGTREFLRAAVDYDGIVAAEPERFNLVVQRLRTAGSETIEAQETYRRISIRAGAERNLIDVLANSKLVRVLGELPPARPLRSQWQSARAAGYACSNADGDDGDELTLYDIIGEPEAGTGLFALRSAPPFNFLYIPPLSRELDVGLPAQLVALRLCREQQALLLVDPPASWTDSPRAIEALRTWPLRSEDALMFFPRLRALDRLRGHEEIFGSGAAAAGLLAAATARSPVWSAAGIDELPMRAGLKTCALITDLDQIRLAQAGVNVLPATLALALPRLGLRTLLPEATARDEERYLSARRLALFLMSSIERGTSWALLEHSGPALWSSMSAQVIGFFEALEDEGAFVGAKPEENYFVICDERLNGEASAAAGVRLLFGVALSRPGEFRTCLVEHRPGASSVRAVSVNRFALPELP
jgi:uncharacterized protein